MESFQQKKLMSSKLIYRKMFGHLHHSKIFYTFVPISNKLSPTELIHPCHTAAILSRETKRALFYHAKPRNGNHGAEA